jgi:hypothetical protein
VVVRTPVLDTKSRDYPLQKLMELGCLRPEIGNLTNLSKVYRSPVHLNKSFKAERYYFSEFSYVSARTNHMRLWDVPEKLDELKSRMLESGASAGEYETERRVTLERLLKKDRVTPESLKGISKTL